MEMFDLEFFSKEDMYTLMAIRSLELSLEMHYYSAKEKGKALLAVGGIGGGFDSPARGLYPTLGKELLTSGISTLRLKYRQPNDFTSCVQDVLYGIKALSTLGHQRIALIGHSLGGAVVIAAALKCSEVVSIITLSTQSYGAIPAAGWLRQQSLLLIHGIDDEILPPTCSQEIYRIAQCPKEIHLLAGNRHCLDESAEKIKQICTQWIQSTL